MQIVKIRLMYYGVIQLHTTGSKGKEPGTIEKKIDWKKEKR